MKSKSVKSIVLHLGGKDIEVPVEEAERPYVELAKMFEQPKCTIVNVPAPAPVPPPRPYEIWCGSTTTSKLVSSPYCQTT